MHHLFEDKDCTDKTGMFFSDHAHKQISPNKAISFSLILFIIILYCQTNTFDNIQLDDHLWLFNGHVDRGLTIENIQWAFSPADKPLYAWMPLTWLSFLLDSTIYGMNFGGYHVTNMLLHILNTLLLFTVIKRMTNTIYRAGLVALLFAIHPINVESVAWIAERNNVLSTFFWMTTLLFYERYVRSQKKNFLPMAISFLLGLMSKPMLVSLPFVLLLLDFWPLGRMRRPNNQPMGYFRFLARLIWEKWPLFLLSIIFIIITFMAYHSQQSGSASGSSAITWPTRIENALIAYLCYLKKMIWPFDLAIHYLRPASTPVWQPLIALVFLLAATLTAISRIKQQPYIIVGWLWFLGTLIPVIGLVVIGPIAVADRYAYITFIGLFIMIIWYIHDLTSEYFPRNKVIFSTITILIPICLMGLTWNQIRYWQNSETLFKRAIRICPANSVAYHSLALFLADHNRHDEAIPHFKTAIQLSPNFTDAYYNLGNSFLQKDMLGEAIHFYLQTISKNPKYAPAFNNLGMAYVRNGDLQNGITSFKKSIAIDPAGLRANANFKLTQYITDTMNSSYQNFLSLIDEEAKNCAWIESLNQEKQRFDNALRLYNQFMSKQRGFSRLRTENMPDVGTIQKKYLEYLPLIQSMTAGCSGKAEPLPEGAQSIPL